MDWNTVSLAFQFFPKLPVIERGAAKLRDDDGFVSLVDDIPKLHDTVSRLGSDPDVQAMIEVGKDLFKALALDGGSTRVAQVLVKHGASPDQVTQAFASLNQVGPVPEGPSNPQI